MWAVNPREARTLNILVLIQLGRYRRPSVYLLSECETQGCYNCSPLLNNAADFLWWAVEQRASFNASTRIHSILWEAIGASVFHIPIRKSWVLANCGEEWRESISCQVKWVISAVRGPGGWELQARLHWLSCIQAIDTPWNYRGASGPESVLVLGRG